MILLDIVGAFSLCYHHFHLARLSTLLSLSSLSSLLSSSPLIYIIQDLIFIILLSIGFIEIIIENYFIISYLIYRYRKYQIR